MYNRIITNDMPKYAINDQVIVISKDKDISYFLGIVKAAHRNLDNGKYWMYKVNVDSTIIEVEEGHILGHKFEKKDITPELQKIEDAINID